MKNEFIKWTPLSPLEIYLCHKEMGQTAMELKKIYEKSEPNEKAKIRILIGKLLRKTSAKEACKVLIEISELFIGDSLALLGFCTQEKFSGLFGINHMVNIVLGELYYSAGIKSDIFSSFGGVSIKNMHERKLKLGLMLEQHDEFQSALDLCPASEAEKIRNLIEKVKACSMQRTYPLCLLMEYGNEIKEILSPFSMSIIPNPIELGISWSTVKIPYEKLEDKNFDFYSIANDKEDGGYFQYLCITLFSLKFDSVNQ